MIEIITDIASCLSGLMVIVSFVGLLAKPTRKKIESWIKKVTSSEETIERLDTLSTETTDKFSELSEKLDQQNLKIDQQKQKSDAADKQILAHIQDIDSKLIKVDERVFENERDRIKAELSEYASRCARGLRIYPEEMLHIDEMYHKYKDEMHCNSSGSQNYQTIVNYYGNQAFLK